MLDSIMNLLIDSQSHCERARDILRDESFSDDARSEAVDEQLASASEHLTELIVSLIAAIAELN